MSKHNDKILRRNQNLDRAPRPSAQRANYGRSGYSSRRPKVNWIALIACLIGAVVVFTGSFLLATSLLKGIAKPSEEELRAAESLSVNDRVNRYESPYDWSGLDRTDGRYSYFENGQLRSMLGIDVSSHQKHIDWNAVAQDGIDFAIIRLGNRGYTEGGLMVDEYAAFNLDGASAVGLKIGAYFFSQATTPEEAREEARFALEILDGRALDLPIAFDHERISGASGRANNIDRDTLTECALEFCKIIESAGYRTMIYGNAKDMARFYLYQLEGRSLWHAEYGVPSPLVFYDIALWQYSSSGTVAGISGSVDMNILFTDAL